WLRPGTPTSLSPTETGQRRAACQNLPAPLCALLGPGAVARLPRNAARRDAERFWRLRPRHSGGGTSAIARPGFPARLAAAALRAVQSLASAAGRWAARLIR